MTEPTSPSPQRPGPPSNPWAPAEATASPTAETTAIPSDPYAAPVQAPAAPPQYGATTVMPTQQGYGAAQPSYGQPPVGQPPYGQGPYGQGPYGQQPYGWAPQQAPRTNGLAIAALVLGVLALGAFIPFVGFFSLLLALVGIGLGIAGISKARTLGSGKGMAIGGLVLSVVSLLGGGAVQAAIVWGISNAAESGGFEEFEDFAEELDAPMAEDDPRASDPLAVGGTATLGDFELTVTDVDADAAAALRELDPSLPEVDGRYVLVTLEATNVGDEAANPWFDTYVAVLGGDDVSYDESTCDAMTPQPGDTMADVPPGGTATYTTCVVVEPSGVDGAVLYAEPTFSMGAERAFWAY